VALVDVEEAMQRTDDRQIRERPGEVVRCPLGDPVRRAEQEGAVAVVRRLAEQILADVVVGQPGWDRDVGVTASVPGAAGFLVAPMPS
jgi:hypothetical protein